MTTTAADPRTATILDAIGDTPLVRDRRHLGQARVPQPVRLDQGAHRPLHDRAGRARGPAAARRHDRRGDQRQHRQRDEHGRRGQGLPHARGHARGDEPGAGRDLPGVRRRGPDRRRLPRHRRRSSKARELGEPAGLLRPAAVRLRVERRREPRVARTGDARASCPDGVVPDAIVGGRRHRRDADRRRAGVPRRQPGRRRRRRRAERVVHAHVRRGRPAPHRGHQPTASCPASSPAIAT